MTKLREEIEQQNIKKMKAGLQVSKGEDRIDSNENLIQGIEEKQENNQENENKIKKEVEKKREIMVELPKTILLVNCV